MAGWVTATGRTIGILTSSALLLMSATLGQNGQAPPAGSIPPPAVEAVTEEEPDSNQPDTTRDEIEVAGDPPATSPQVTEPQVTQSGITATDTLPSGKPVPRAGSGIVPPDTGVRFNIATPVRMAPVRLQIPAAWVDAPVQTVGVTPDGEMEAPDDFWEVGWYRYGTRPGDAGRAVIAGHVDSYDGAAVFYHIGDLEPGDEIRVLLGGPDGERFYTVREVAHYPADQAPVEHIFGPSDHSELVLITCSGDWQGSDAGYSHRIVVYADMVAPQEMASPETPRS